jgi:hypothetical protein
MQDPRADAALEERPEAQHSSSHLLEEFAGDPVIEDRIGQEAKMPKPTERRTRRIVVEKVPMLVLRRRYAC